MAKVKLKIKDPVIKKVVKKIVGRSKVGLKKYGVSLRADPTNLDGWLNHLQEELMDAVNYIERAREAISSEPQQLIEGPKEQEQYPGGIAFSAGPVISSTNTVRSCSLPITPEKCCKDG
tara:strand:+ start:8185 stop:8541 length:357 start_codon:yes stop_codon:yes gene_type:complete